MNGSKHSPGPWIADPVTCEVTDETGVSIGCAFDNPDTGLEDIEDEPSHWNAKLMAAAPDHALFAAAIVSGKAKWAPYAGGSGDGEIVCNGLRYSVVLDEFGIPILTEAIRKAITGKEAS